VIKEVFVSWARVIRRREPTITSLIREQLETLKRLPAAKAFLALGFHKNSIEYIATESQLAQCISKIREAWAHLGLKQPHFSVLADKQFLPNSLSENIEHFWASGQMELAIIQSMLVRHGVSSLASKACVEFGCGVGRVTLALAPHCLFVHGYDISEGHLDHAKKRAAILDIQNCQFVLCSDTALEEMLPCDFFYSRLVFQHNPPPVIYQLIMRALRALNPDGIAIFQVPVYMVGYEFNIEKWLHTKHELDMQMHCLPQDIIFSLLYDANCELLEVQQDDSTGSENSFISNIFVVRKRSNGANNCAPRSTS
jgi:SAM-dependent methyltransferase